VPLQTNAPALLAQAVAPLDRVVSPDAVAAVTDAFRKGQISADDIIERYGELAKTKEKAQIQNLHEFISPEAIDARKAATQLMGDRAKAEASSLPLEFQAKEATYQATKIAAQQGDNKAMRDVAIKHGFGGYLSAPGADYTGTDTQKDQKAYQMAVRYENAVKGAADIEKDVNVEPYEVTDANGAVTRDPSKDALRSKTSAVTYTPEQAVRAKRLANMTPEQYIAAGSPTVDDYVFGGTQGEGGGASHKAPGVVPVKDLATPRKTVVTKTTSPDGTVTEKTETIEATTHPNPDAATVINPEVETFPAIGVNPQKPALDLSGAYVKKAAKEPKETASEVTEKEKLLSQISNADQFQVKLDRVRQQINDALVKPVGPGYSEGSRVSQLLNGVGAFLGIDSATLKNQTQDQLRQFLAQHVQATIRSMAGSGNRVMKAEVDNSPGSMGLFYQAAPSLTSTPETWNIWLNDLNTLFKDARRDAVFGLPDTDRAAYSTPPASAPAEAKKPVAEAAHPDLTLTGGAKAVFDASKGKYVFVPAGSPSPTDKPAASAASIAARGLKNIAVAPWTDLFK